MVGSLLFTLAVGEHSTFEIILQIITGKVLQIQRFVLQLELAIIESMSSS